jgi:hypothetical protein
MRGKLTSFFSGYPYKHFLGLFFEMLLHRDSSKYDLKSFRSILNVRNFCCLDFILINI